MMRAEVGNALWESLHQAARFTVAEQQTFFPSWLEMVRAQLGCKSCEWKLDRFMRLWQVDYGEGFYMWSICLHDYVNKELGKGLFFPNLTLAPLAYYGIIQ